MQLLKLISIAWRNMWRNRRRTLITLTGIVFGTMLAVIFTGLGDHSWTKMINIAARMGGGHVTLQHPEYLQTPSLKRTITGVKDKSAKALADPNVEKVVSRITGNTLLAAGGNTSGAFFIAFDPKQEDINTFAIMDTVIKGKMLDASKGRGVVLGWKLAENLGIELGHRVVYTLTDKSGEIVSGMSRVSGIIKTGARSVDAGICMLPIDTVREILGYGPDEVTQVALFVDDHRRSHQVAARTQAQIGPAAAAVAWDEAKPDLASFISMKTGGTVFMELFIGLLVAAGIFNTLFVSVMERRREFGIMMAIGYSPLQLFTLVMIESAWVALCGLVLAGLVTAWPYYYLNTTGLDLTMMIGKAGGAEVAGVAMQPIMKVAIFPENLLMICAAVFAATMAAGLYPAWRAGRVSPVESIKLV